jgi:predicted nucleic acid-binding protein
VDAFDTDVLIYAAVPRHPLGDRVLELFRRAGQSGDLAGTGSVLLLPELLSNPIRDGAAVAARALSSLLARLDLRPLDRATADIATALAARYGLRAADASHLAAAVGLGADRFITNNQRDFPLSVTEIRVTYPASLPAP